MENFSQWLNESSFKTSKGSVYKFSNGKSQRNKSVHSYHDRGDSGEKPISERTVFINPKLAQEIGMWGSSSAPKKRIILFQGKIYLLSLNERSQAHGQDKIYADNSFVNEPEIGLCPLELWKLDVTKWPWSKAGMEVYKDSHPGNDITEIIED